ncbi:MAG: phosphate ABC transporter permease subunit PstC [Prevotellaceae bacterium]|jgi:phosphate transport system permease protein|nr:phosphate ABC transporter permease subunit PstC [Prevotellaceae bacterium]
MKRFLEKLVEGILMISGSLTSVAILLIIIFLFKEGIGLFNSPEVEKGYVLSVSQANPVNSLSPLEVKDIFDGEITNWKQVGGTDEEIMIFRFDDIFNYYPEEEMGENYEFLPDKLSSVVQEHATIIAFLPEKYLSVSFQGKLLDKKNISPLDFFFGKEWFPTSAPVAQYGVLPLILGTLWVSLGAILIALPFGLAVAIYLAEIADVRMRKVLKPVIELLAGIPSVVYGFFGLVVIVPFLQSLFRLPVGETALAGSVVLAIMALPTIITVAEDAIRTTPRIMKEASLGLGANHWQTIYRVILPYARSGILAAVVLGIGRAIGETMAVLMVTGNAAIIPATLLEPVRTIPATIAAELGEAPAGGAHYQSLFMLGCVLFVITLVLSVAVEIISGKRSSRGV